LATMAAGLPLLVQWSTTDRLNSSLYSFRGLARRFHEVDGLREFGVQEWWSDGFDGSGG